MSERTLRVDQEPGAFAAGKVDRQDGCSDRLRNEQTLFHELRLRNVSTVRRRKPQRFPVLHKEGLGDAPSVLSGKSV